MEQGKTIFQKAEHIIVDDNKAVEAYGEHVKDKSNIAYIDLFKELSDNIKEDMNKSNKRVTNINRKECSQ